MVLGGCSGGGDSSKKTSEKKAETENGGVPEDNLIKNGDFSKGKEGFSLYTNGGAAKMDVNEDGKIDALDASYILCFYAYISVTKDEPITLKVFMLDRK